MASVQIAPPIMPSAVPVWKPARRPIHFIRKDAGMVVSAEPNT